MKNLQELLKRTSKDFAKSERDFYKSSEKIKELSDYSDLVKLNSAERLRNRLSHLSINRQVDKLSMERIIGKNQLMDVNYFSKGLKVAKTVGRIVQIRGEHIQPIGTGFLVAPNLLMTNNHVIESKYDAEIFMVEFEYEKNNKGDVGETTFFHFNPSAFFITNESLDFTVVAVEPIAQNNPEKKLENYGYNKLISSKKLIIKGERVSIIQHPEGLPKMIAFRENKVIEIKDSFIHYTTDTQKGSSGSLVLNDQWEVVALHRAGVPRTDANGNILSKKGKIIRDESDHELIDWVANQGVMMDAILKDISKKILSKEEKNYKDELLKDFELEGTDYKLPKKKKA